MFVVWSSQLGAKERNVADATRLIADHRARHYWDPARLVGQAVTRRLQLMFGRAVTGEPAAWDVWLLFDRRARWDSLPPVPAWWEHQTNMLPPERHLDPKRFAAKARALETALPARNTPTPAR